MKTLHIVAIVVSIIILLVGSFGFLRKKLGFWASYVSWWFGVSLFAFGILPTQFPDWSLGRQIVFSLLLAIASFIVVGLLLKYILAAKGYK